MGGSALKRIIRVRGAGVVKHGFVGTEGSASKLDAGGGSTLASVVGGCSASIDALLARRCVSTPLFNLNLIWQQISLAISARSEIVPLDYSDLTTESLSHSYRPLPARRETALSKVLP